jgi:recombination protein RecA
MVVNTVAGLTPKKEMEGSVGDQDMALIARMMSKLMRKIAAIAAKQKTHVAFVNQVRSTMGMGNDVPAGGKALAYWARQRVYMKAGFIEEADKSKGYDPEIFKKIETRVTKNTCATSYPYKKCTYYVEYGVGIDKIGELPSLAISAGVITLKGAWHYEYEPGTEKLVTLPNGDFARWQGVGAFRGYLREHPEYVESLRARVSGEIFTVDTMSDDEVEDAKAEEAALTADLKDEKDDVL